MHAKFLLGGDFMWTPAWSEEPVAFTKDLLLFLAEWYSFFPLWACFFPFFFTQGIFSLDFFMGKDFSRGNISFHVRIFQARDVNEICE